MNISVKLSSTRQIEIGKNTINNYYPFLANYDCGEPEYVTETIEKDENGNDIYYYKVTKKYPMTQKFFMQLLNREKDDFKNVIVERHGMTSRSKLTDLI